MRLPALTLATAMLLAAVLISAPAAAGVQHLVSPGDDIAKVAARLRPGDELVLLPGEHQHATLLQLHGTEKRPITIRSLNAEHPAVIQAERFGLRLVQPQHIHLQDIIVTGATINGIELLDAPTDETRAADADDALHEAHVLLKNVTVEHTGPIGQRHAVLAAGMQHLTLEACHFEGWGGAAVQLVACADVTVDGCTFQGVENYSQMHGVQVRGGSQRVRISSCHMHDAGVAGVAIGGNSEPSEFRSASKPPAHEASRVRVMTNVFEGGLSAVAFINCRDSVVSNNTIVRPRRWVYLVLDREGSGRSATEETRFGVNLITWQPGDIERLSHVRSGADPSGLTLEQNLWWSADLAESRARLGEPAGTIQFEQKYSIDPKLDDRLVPTADGAGTFGYETP